MDVNLIGDILGLSTLIGSVFANVPQIVSILKHRKVEGLSFNAFAIETYSITIQVLYFVVQQYHYMAYADIVALLLQNYVILGSILVFGKDALDFKKYGNVLAYVACLIAIVNGTITKEMIIAVMNAVVLLNVTSKLTFIGSILATKDSSNMVPAGWLIFVYSNAVRVFTSHVMLGDTTLTIQNLINLLFNTIIVLMIFKYKNSSAAVQDKKE